MFLIKKDNLMKQINGYDLSHNFFDWAFEHRQEFKPTVSALYFYLVEVCNKLGWKNEFSISAKECMEGMGVSSYNTYKHAFDILCDNGFITIVKKSCNHFQANIITLSNFNRVTDELPNKVTQEYRESNYQSNGDILKTIKTIKTNKTNRWIDLVDERFKEIIGMWIEYKTERREAYKTEKSFTLMVAKLKQMSGDDRDKAKLIVEQSMSNNWSGLFELKNVNNEQITKTRKKLS